MPGNSAMAAPGRSDYTSTVHLWGGGLRLNSQKFTLKASANIRSSGGRRLVTWRALVGFVLDGTESFA